MESSEGLREYQALLNGLFPDNRSEIAAIIEQMNRAMEYTDVLYGIDNPAFLDMKKDREYFVKAILPWMFKYAFTIHKVSALKIPLVDCLKRYTNDEALIDIIAQHFFQATPAYFALSYFTLYLDYGYPPGGTGKLPEKLVNFIKDQSVRSPRERSPGMAAGILERFLDWKQLLGRRLFPWRQALSAMDRKLYAMELTTPAVGNNRRHILINAD